jgi:hypothetical protein
MTTKCTKWFFDTEFLENGKTIELISLGLVNSDGEGWYWETERARELATRDPWLAANVLPHLRGGSWVCPRNVIASEIANIVLDNTERPEFWAYFASYDWVALCQLYGRMIDLPTGFPKYCRDLKQLMDDLEVKKSDLPAQDGEEHNALADARWNRDAYLWIAGHRFGP